MMSSSRWIDTGVYAYYMCILVLVYTYDLVVGHKPYISFPH